MIPGKSLGSANSEGFLYSSGVFTGMSIPDSTYTWAHGINDSGQFVGIYSPFLSPEDLHCCS